MKANAAVIDLVTHDPASDEYALIMVETRPWDGSEERREELQDKINNYLSFALDGQMSKLYPASRGKPLRLQLDCASPLDPTTAEFIDQVSEQLRSEGIRFLVNLIGPPK
jgi:hypothetical protein